MKSRETLSTLALLREVLLPIPRGLTTADASAGQEDTVPPPKPPPKPLGLASTMLILGEGLQDLLASEILTVFLVSFNSEN